MRQWSWLGAVVGVMLVLAGRQGGPSGAAGWPQTVTLDGELAFADYERLLERTFEVPPGTRRVEVRLDYTGGDDRRTVVDLGLRGPAGLRGWSGGRERRVEVSALTATSGYLSGPIEAGTWAVLLGVANIRRDSHDRYRLTIILHDDDLAPFTRVLRDGPGWFVGDLHVHSGHSDGRVPTAAGQAVGAPVHRVFDAARAAGLDFVALTDHNTASHWLDVDRLQAAYEPLLLLHGREVTTYRGHANTVGERRFTDFRLPAPDATPADLLRPIARSGAFVSINHPTAPDDERCMGCGWNVANDEVLGSVHGVEVVNGDVRSGPLFGWTYWAALLNGGHHVTAVGGSDDHTPADDGDRRIGTPATVVWAATLSEPAIVDGLRSGRVYIRTRGPQGPTLEFSARTASRVVPMGGTVDLREASRVTFEACLTGADGEVLEWIRNGEAWRRATIDRHCLTAEVVPSAGDWFSLVVRDGADPTVIANAIRVAPAVSQAPR